jgi:hypothetical protein
MPLTDLLASVTYLQTFGSLIIPPPPCAACRWVATKWLHDRAITEWDGEARH